MLDGMVHDLIGAWRSLRARPAFTVVALSTLGLGIGANAAIFSMTNAVLLRPLNFPDAQRLVSVYTAYLPATGNDLRYSALSGPEYEDYRAHTRALETVAAYRWFAGNLSAPAGEPARVSGVRGSAALFTVLGTRPLLGRTFVTGDDALGAPCVAVLSHGLWREYFGADTTIVDRDVRLDGAACRVIGVMPSGFSFPNEQARLWTALQLDRSDQTWGRSSHWLLGVARMRTSVTPDQAAADLDALHSRWNTEFAEHYAQGHFIVLMPLQEDVAGSAFVPLALLMGSAVVVLFIICANLGGLMAVRADARAREMAVRAALGASRWRIARQTLTENIGIALLGGVLGLLAANWLLDGFLRLYPGDLPRRSEIRVDGAVVLFTAASSLIAGTLFGMLPALRSARRGLSDALSAEGRSTTATPGRVRVRSLLVVSEMALSLMLVAGALLLVRSYVNIRDTDVGVEPANVTVFDLHVPAGSVSDVVRARRTLHDIEERVARVPGIISAGIVSNLPLASPGPPDDFQIEGRPDPVSDRNNFNNARYLMVTPGFFNTLGVSIKAGRAIEDRDAPGQPLVAVINEALARNAFPGEDPIGKRIRYGFVDPNAPWITIVGIANDIRSVRVQDAAPPAIYVPHAQAPRPPYEGRAVTILLRTAGTSPAILSGVRAAVASVDRSLPLSNLAQYDDIVQRAIGQPRFTMLLMTFFALVALLLGALGIYGVIGYVAQQRAREMGVRMALGANPREVFTMMVSQGLRLCAMGITLGLVGALVARNALAGLLYGVAPTDPLMLGGSALLLLFVGMLACSLPALRSARSDPMIILRG